MKVIVFEIYFSSIMKLNREYHPKTSKVSLVICVEYILILNSNFRCWLKPTDKNKQKNTSPKQIGKLCSRNFKT